MLLLAGCGGPDAVERTNLLNRHLLAQGFQPLEVVRAGNFHLAMWSRTTPGARQITVFFEGDGSAYWRGRPSKDPTPRNPVGARLAAVDDGESVVYVGRPCQYVQRYDRGICHPQVWTLDRFSEDVVVAHDAILDTLKARLGNREFRLVGFSGGGAVAALLALRRCDVRDVRAVASPLNVHGLMAYHKMRRLTGSLDPYDDPALKKLPHILFLSSSDEVVSEAALSGYLAAFRGVDTFKLVQISGLEHTGPWEKRWPELSKIAVPGARKVRICS